MKWNVGEFAKMTGVSVRTLHYYDEIGLLKPDAVSRENGYRVYGEHALETMQQILFYRELDFPLKHIRDMLCSPHYNKQQALADQRQLLLLKKERLERILKALDRAAKGETAMNFSTFDTADIERYKDEVKQRFGNTDAYRESQKKTAGFTQDTWNRVAEELDRIFAGFAALKVVNADTASAEAGTLAKRLQDFITETQYTCTDDILLSLGEMYVADERFTKNIDRHGDGTAAFARDAIRAYCEAKKR